MTSEGRLQGVDSATRTIYAVAVLFMHPGRDKHILTSEIFIVSGHDPLTDDEAKARGRRYTESRWRPEEFGPLSEWEFKNASLSSVVVTSR